MSELLLAIAATLVPSCGNPVFPDSLQSTCPGMIPPEIQFQDMEACTRALKNIIQGTGNIYWFCTGTTAKGEWE
jgi:hypothetical protein